MDDKDKDLNPGGQDDLGQDDDQDDDSTDVDTKKSYDAKYVRKLKEEAKSRRLKLRDVEVELNKLKDEKLTDTEKKDARIKELDDKVIELESEGKNIKLESVILGIASTKGFFDLNTVLLIAKDELSGEEEVDEKMIEKVVDKIAKEKPFLVTGGSPNPSSGNFPKTDKEPAKDVNQMMGDFLHGK